MELYVEKHKPDVIGIVETHLEETEKFEIEGYELWRNDRNEEGGGVAVAIKKEYKHVIIETSKYKEKEESIWVLHGSETKYKIGVWYNPRGDAVKKQELKEMYNRLEEEIGIGKNRGQKIILMGDFNCRVGELIKGNEERISKGGKYLKKVVEKKDLVILNTVEKTIGRWTRIEGNQKSIIDYVIMDKSEEENILKMEIDEEKEWTPYHIVRKEGKLRTIYTDHTSIKVVKQWNKERGVKEANNKIMTMKGWGKFGELLNKENISSIIDPLKSIEETYGRWEKKVMEIKRKCERKISKKKVTLVQKTLMSAKGRIKKSKHKSSRVEIERRRLITSHIEKEIREGRSR